MRYLLCIHTLHKDSCWCAEACIARTSHSHWCTESGRRACTPRQWRWRTPQIWEKSHRQLRRLDGGNHGDLQRRIQPPRRSFFHGFLWRYCALKLDVFSFMFLNLLPLCLGAFKGFIWSTCCNLLKCAVQIKLPCQPLSSRRKYLKMHWKDHEMFDITSYTRWLNLDFLNLEAFSLVSPWGPYWCFCFILYESKKAIW